MSFGGVTVIVSAVGIGFSLFVNVAIVDGLLILLSVVLDSIVGDYGVVFWAERV